MNTKRYLAEFFGTFLLVFAGTGVIVINEVSGGVITHLGIALTFGLVCLLVLKGNQRNEKLSRDRVSRLFAYPLTSNG